MSCKWTFKRWRGGGGDGIDGGELGWELGLITQWQGHKHTSTPLAQSNKCGFGWESCRFLYLSLKRAIVAHHYCVSRLKLAAPMFEDIALLWHWGRKSLIYNINGRRIGCLPTTNWTTNSDNNDKLTGNKIHTDGPHLNTCHDSSVRQSF